MVFLVVFLQLCLEVWCSSWVVMGPQGPAHDASGNSGLLSSCEGHLGIPIELLQWNRASFCVEAGNSVLLSNCTRDLGIPIEFQKGSQASSPF